MKHSLSASKLQTVCSVHVANYPSQVVSFYYVRDSVILRLTEWAEAWYRAVKFAKMIIETSMSSQNLSGRSKVSPIHSDQILRELVPPQNVRHLGMV